MFCSTCVVIQFIVIMLKPSSEVVANQMLLQNTTFEETYAYQAATTIYYEFETWYFTLLRTERESCSFENDIMKHIETVNWGFPMMILGQNSKIDKCNVDSHGETTYIVTYPKLSITLSDGLITILKNVKTWNPHSKVVFVVKNPVETTKYYMDDVKRHFVLLWSRSIVDSVLIMWSNGLKIFTFNPFTGHVINISSKSSVREILNQKFWDLKGYPIRVSLFSDISSESWPQPKNCNDSIAWGILSALKASCVALEPRDHGTTGLIYDNGTASGATADLMSGYTDIEMNSRILKQNYYGSIDTTYPTSQDDLVFIIAKGVKQKNWSAVLDFLSPTSLLILISIMVATSALALWFHKLEWLLIGFGKKHRIGYVAMDLLKCFLRQSVHIRFSGMAFRIIVLSIQIYSLILNCGIDGVLTTAITYPRYFPDINTLNELNQADYKIIIHKRHVDIVTKYLAPDFGSAFFILKEHEIKDLIDKKDNGNAFIMRKSKAQRLRRTKSHMVNGRPFYHIVKESAVPCLTVFAMSYGSPYFSRVDYLLKLLSQSGILLYWEKVSTYSLYYDGDKALYENVSKVKSPLNTEHTRGIFYLWSFGIIISTVAFVGEVFAFAFKKG